MADDTKTAPASEPAEASDGGSTADDSAADESAAAEMDSSQNFSGAGDEAGGDEFHAAEIGPDGIDPELLSLPLASPIRIGPVMSISVLVFCFYIAIKVYPDLRFSRSGDRPTHYDSAAELLNKASPEQLVSVNAVPDRSYAMHVAHSQADDGSRLMPAQGSDGKLWLLIGGNVWNTAIEYHEQYAGRLRALSDMPFYDSFKKHVRARGAGPRFIEVEALRAALGGGGSAGAQPVTLREPAGDMVAVAPDTPVQIYETVTDRVRIHIFPTERMPKKEDLIGALRAAQLIPEGLAEPERGLADSWIFVVDVPGGATAARARLIEAKLFSANCAPVKRLHEGTVGALKSTPTLVTIGSNPVLWSNVTWASVEVPRTVPDDALVLVTMEHPGSYWYVLPLFVFLALAILFFLYALVRAVKPT